MHALSHQRPDSVIPYAMETPGEVLDVGIDIAKDSHVAVAIRGTGVRITGPFRFSSTPEGLEQCAGWVEKLAARFTCRHVFIGMEPTNIYWRPVYNYLVDRLPKCGVYIVPSINVHMARRMHGSNLSKTDPQDAFIIAERVRQGNCNRPIRHTTVTRQLRDALHTYIRADRDATRLKTKLVDSLSVIFPEAVDGASGDTMNRRLDVLCDVPVPRDIVQTSQHEWVTMHVKRGRSRASLNTLYCLACSSNTHPPVSPYWQDTWDITATAWRSTCAQRDDLHTLILRMLKDIPHVDALLTVPGVGPLTVASFFAGVGDIRQYRRAAQIERVFGFDLHRWQSGTMDAPPRLSKRGYSPARRNFYLAALSASQQPPFNQWYLRHFPNQKRKGARKTIIALAAKLVRVCFHIARTGTPFDPMLAVRHE